MAKALVVVESPAKAKTINKYLGKDYKVVASMGHVRDLPKSKLGVDVEEGFEPSYEVIASRKKVLAELKADPVLKVIPVVILTTSQAEQDILRSYALHANAYVSKPVDFERFMEVIRQIDDFFVTVVQLAR